jgi:hypothetical protein
MVGASKAKDVCAVSNLPPISNAGVVEIGSTPVFNSTPSSTYRCNVSFPGASG